MTHPFLPDASPAPGRRRACARYVLGAILALTAAPAAAVPPGSSTAAAALARCTDADALHGEAKRQALSDVRALAERSLAADPGDALAHFALFCAMGKQMQAAGVGLGQLHALGRLRRALEATLALAPDDVDALTAKGAFLLSLPRLLGGDASEAERALRRALMVDPTNAGARCYLRRALADRGAEAEARALETAC